MVRALSICLMALLCMAASRAAAEGRLFSDAQPLRIGISAPFKALIAASKSKTDPYPATLTVTEGAGPAQSLHIQMRARGMSRRTLGYCRIPPLQLAFGDKATLKGTPFQGQRKLKLVDYCRDESDYEQRIVLEYLAYRLYNIITPMSFRVRGADVTYREGDKDAGVTRFGYLIENLDDLADRNHLPTLTLASHQITAGQFDAKAAARATLFEFMIGNLDWDLLAVTPGLECCHNSRFIAARTSAPLTGVVPVVYDFDSSGFVDAPYAGPPPDLPVNSVTERLYRGYCASNDEIPSVVAEFRAHRAEMTALVNGEPRLNQRFRAKAARFLDGFFAVLDDPARVQNQILKRCR